MILVDAWQHCVLRAGWLVGLEAVVFVLRMLRWSATAAPATRTMVIQVKFCQTFEELEYWSY